tara:strand:+ start:196 stop:357 length:162 start_codon:yes stop_codon:yes gene_type:complete
MVDFSELFKATVLEINNSNRMLAKEAQRQQDLEEAQAHTLEEDNQPLDFNEEY